MTAAPESGWYPDPAGPADTFRWWDGQDWTDATSESAQTPAPVAQRDLGPARVDRAARRRTSSLRHVVVLAIGLALFLTASAGIGLILWGEPANDEAVEPGGGQGGIGSRPTAIDTAATGQLDQRTRTATVGPAALVMPDAPYALYPDPMRLAGVLDVFFCSGATVHQRYDGRHDWSAAVLLGRVSTSMTSGDLESQGRRTMYRLGRTFFGDHATEVKDVSWSNHPVGQRPGVRFSATIGYSVPKLPSRYDRLTALLVRLDDGSVIIAAAAVPNDADPQVARQARESLNTLTIR